MRPQTKPAVAGARALHPRAAFCNVRRRYVVEFVDYSEKQATDKEHVRVPKSEQVVIHLVLCVMCDV